MDWINTREEFDCKKKEANVHFRAKKQQERLSRNAESLECQSQLCFSLAADNEG